jgi:hypothetical protein
MIALQDALQAEAQERGYSFPTIAFAALAEPKVIITKVSRWAFNLEIADYFRSLPEALARSYAASIMDYITGGVPTIPEGVRTYLREHSIDRYIQRRGYLLPEEVKALDLAPIVTALKENGQIASDLQVVWTTDPSSSFFSPTFRLIAIPTYLLDDRDEGAIITEIIANYRIMCSRMGVQA